MAPTPVLPGRVSHAVKVVFPPLRNHAGMAGADYLLLVEADPATALEGLGKQGFLLALLLTLLLFLAALVLALLFLLR